MEILKVSTKSNPNSVAGALANVFREKGVVEIQAVGAGALNQAIKAVAIARGFVAPSGVDLINIGVSISINPSLAINARISLVILLLSIILRCKSGLLKSK